MATARTVKDVSPHEFVKAYSAHLKRSGKVNLHKASHKRRRMCIWVMFFFSRCRIYYGSFGPFD